MNILERQNEKLALDIQVSSRIFFDKADNADLLQWCITVILPILKILFVENTIMDILLILWFFLSIFINRYIVDCTEKATKLRKNFDYYVYGWNSSFPKEILSMSREIKAKNQKYFSVQTFNSGTDKPKGVKDWYTTPKENMINEEAIEAAMRENLYFDDNINRIAFFLLVSLVCITIFSFALSGIKVMDALIGLFITFSTFTLKIYMTFVNNIKVREINNNAKKLLFEENLDLRYIQSEIDRKREIPGTSNKLIYMFRSNKLHEESEIYSSLD